MSKHSELLQRVEMDEPYPDSTNGHFLLSQDEGSSVQNTYQVDDEVMQLVQRIFLFQSSDRPHIVVFASIDSGSGCSEISSSVAEILAMNADRPVCLVDASRNAPRSPGRLREINNSVYADTVLSKARKGSYSGSSPTEKFWLISTSSLTTNSGSLLRSDLVREKMDELRSKCDFVIVNAPPLTQYSDAIVFGQSADGLVLVLEANSTKRVAASAAVANLRSVNIPILAAVLNKRTFPIPESIYKRL